MGKITTIESIIAGRDLRERKNALFGSLEEYGVCCKKNPKSVNRKMEGKIINESNNKI